eukprot:175139-Rhodomonas_salina.2
MPPHQELCAYACSSHARYRQPDWYRQMVRHRVSATECVVLTHCTAFVPADLPADLVALRRRYGGGAYQLRYCPTHFLVLTVPSGTDGTVGYYDCSGTDGPYGATRLEGKGRGEGLRQYWSSYQVNLLCAYA